MASRIYYSGLVIAGIGFFLTRFTVTLAIDGNPLRFYLAGVVPLLLGLGLAAFGVALAVGGPDRSFVRTTALWCVLGTVGMSVLVVLTLLGSTVGMSNIETIRTERQLATFLIGGSVGGTLTGLYAARNRQQRTVLRQQTNRLVVLNRMLRHEVLNALTPIRGFGTADQNESPEAGAIVAERADDIEATVEEVSYLTKHAGDGQAVGVPIDLEPCLTESVAAVEEAYPDASVVIEDDLDDLRVYGNERLREVFRQLLRNAVVHGGDSSPRIEVGSTRETARISVIDDGEGLPASQERLLETGDIEEFDDPRMGYGLNVVRLLVESYGGEIETEHSDGETRITVVLAQAVESTPTTTTRQRPERLRPGMPNLVVVLGASLLAGVAYGLVSEFLGGSVAGIGVFYGSPDPVVGWLTHEFHSVVFGFVFASLLSLTPEEYRDRTLTSVAVGVGWGLVLWLVAAGIVAPLWLRLLGVEAPLPNVTTMFFATHLVWGVALGLLTALGERTVVPWIANHRGESDT